MDMKRLNALKPPLKVQLPQLLLSVRLRSRKREPLLYQMIAMTLSTNPFEIQKSLPPCTNISECVTFTMNRRVFPSQLKSRLRLQRFLQLYPPIGGQL